jgi:thioredoxin-dependent peroxiredoxin
MKTLRHLFCWISAAALATAALPLSAEPSIEVGQIAPRFSGHDQDGHKWELSRYIGKRYVLLYFYPADDTAGGTAEACGVRDNLVEFKQAGVEVVGVSSDGKDSHKEFAFKNNLSFPLLADTCRQIADAYAARSGGDNKLDRRVSFLIGLNGRILRINNSPEPAGQLKEMAAEIVQLSRKDSL